MNYITDWLLDVIIVLNCVLHLFIVDILELC